MVVSLIIWLEVSKVMSPKSDHKQQQLQKPSMSMEQRRRRKAAEPSPAADGAAENFDAGAAERRRLALKR